MMKKFSFPLLFLVTLSLFLGCSNDSDNNEPDRPVAVDTTANLRNTGDSGNDLLSNSKYSDLRVEIAYVVGFRPTQAAMDDFVVFLKERTFKENIELVYNELASPDEDDLTLEEIADLEKENRTVYNTGDALGVYIYFSDAPAEDDEADQGLVTLGAVYRNTSMIIHEATARKLANQNFIPIADVESSTLNHEFGHLFGLVNLGTPTVNDHESVQTDADGEPVLDDAGDPLPDKHCDVDGCLMNAELRFGGTTDKSALLSAKGSSGLQAGCRLSGKSIVDMLSARTAKGQSLAPGLDAECILDLKSNGGR